MSTVEKLIEDFTVKKDNKWRDEESKELKTLRNSVLKVARIVYDGEEPPKRCMALSKNRKSIAFDLEMVPIIIVVMATITPDAMIPEKFRPLMKKIREIAN